jgi:hypothetical protein
VKTGDVVSARLRAAKDTTVNKDKNTKSLSSSGLRLVKSDEK